MGNYYFGYRIDNIAISTMRHVLTNEQCMPVIFLKEKDVIILNESNLILWNEIDKYMQGSEGVDFIHEKGLKLCQKI